MHGTTVKIIKGCAFWVQKTLLYDRICGAMKWYVCVCVYVCIYSMYVCM